MQKKWDRITAWFSAHASHLIADLRPGASETDLKQLEAQIGEKLPVEFHAFYQIHDGQRNECPQGMFYNLQFMPIKLISEFQAMWSEIQAMNDEMADAMGSSPKGVIKPLYANSKWVPFTHDQQGNHIGIDLDPDSKGTKGQIIVFGRDEDCKKLVASSFTRFIEGFIAQLEGGNFILQDGILEFYHYPNGSPIESSGKHSHDIFGRGI